MIFNDPLQDITWNTVAEFCATQISENSVVDYKRDWPEDLARTIAAMANTLGGLILIGVEADLQERPIVPIAGIENTPRLELRVHDVCEGAIFPPVVPEVKACPNESGSRSVVVIRVPISRQAHAVERNTRVYVRTGNRNSHNELADVSKIEWLLGLRGALEKQREALLERARSRAFPMIGHAVTRAQVTLSEGFLDRHWLEMYAIPTYPSSQLTTGAGGIRDIAMTTVHHPQAGSGGEWFPWSIDIGSGRHVFDGFGVAGASAGPPSIACYHEVSEQGLFYYRERIGREHGRLQEISVLWGALLIKRVHSFLYSSEQLYNAFNYRGPLEIAVALHGIDGLGDLRYSPLDTTLEAAGQRYWSPDATVTVPISTSTFELRDGIIDITVSAIAKLNLAFNDATSDVRIRREIEALDRATRPQEAG